MSNLLGELEAVVDDLPEEWESEAFGRPFPKMVNFLRTHHAEIAAAVRDKQRMDWIENQAHALDWDPHDPMKRVIRADDGAEFCGDTWRESIDAAMSAREGQG